MRQAILDTARQMFLRSENPDDVSIDEVVKAVGCTPPALYYYFATKNALLHEVAKQLLAEFLAGVEPDADASLSQQLQQRGSRYVRWAMDNPNEFRLVFMNPDVTSGTSDPTGIPGMKGLMDDVAAACAAGLIDGDPETVAVNMWAIVHGFAALQVSGFLPAEAVRDGFHYGTGLMFPKLAADAQKMSERVSIAP